MRASEATRSTRGRAALTVLPFAVLLSCSAAAQSPIGRTAGQELLLQGRGPIVRALQADDLVSYSGTRVTVECNQGQEVGRTVQQVWWDGPRQCSAIEFREPASMAGVRVIQSGSDLWQWDPGAQVWLHSAVAQGLLLDTNVRVRKLFDNYVIQQVSRDTVARHDCFVYDILPRLPGNPSRRLYVEVGSFVPLRTENVNGEGDLVNATYWEDIDFHSLIPPSTFSGPGRRERVEEDPVQREGPLGLDDARRRLSFTVAEPGHVPEGYEMAATFVIRQRGQEVALLQWFDGLSLLSLFKQPSGLGDPPTGWEERHANSVSWVGEGYYYTLIGDIIPSELSRIRDSIR